jgi:hypothetical protein
MVREPDDTFREPGDTVFREPEDMFLIFSPPLYLLNRLLTQTLSGQLDRVKEADLRFGSVS